jgi:arylsulfatase A-like enzyme
MGASLDHGKWNILWIMTDEQRCDSLGCYGSRWAHSPAIDRLAAGGVRFENAYTPAPLCVPARTSMITGQYPSTHGVWSNAELGHSINGDLIRRFEEAGYETASFGKSHYSCHQERHLFATEIDQWYSDAVQPEAYSDGYDEAEFGVVKYRSPYTNWILAGRFPEKETRRSEWHAVTDALAWLEGRKAEDEEKPFFLRVSFNAPHTPVAPPQPWIDKIDPGRIDLPEGSQWDRSLWPGWYREWLYEYANSDRLSPEELRKARHHYYAEVAFVDSQVGRLLDGLDEAGLRDSTIIAFCSDHGTHLGDFGLVQKQTFFEPVVKVPFILSIPGHPGSGRSVSSPISIGRLLPTLLSLLGIPSSCDFEPIGAALLAGGEEEPNHTVVSEYTLGSIAKWGLHCPDRLRMVRQGRWKLCYSLESDTEGLLFDLENDPLERHNLFHDDKQRGRVAELRKRAEEATGGKGG